MLGAVALLIVGFLVLSGGDDDDDATGSGITSTSLLASSSVPPTATSIAATTTSTSVGTTLAGVPGEIFLEPKDGIGPVPFTPPVAGDDTSTTTTVPGDTAPVETGPLGSAPFPGETSPPTSMPGEVQPVPGNAPGLYGGTRSRTSCDKEQLVAFLEENPVKAAAWANVHGIDPTGIRAYVDTLTPVLLRTDTRVTNYGFVDGAVPERQVVLEAGTAVMVDEYGVPRVRCYCGNPLTEPKPQDAPVYTGTAWPAFEPDRITVITPSPEPITDLVVVDVASAEPFLRPVGGDGGTDTAAPPDVLTTPPTSAPTTTVAPTTEAPTTTIAPTTTAEPETTVPATAPPTTAPPPVDLTSTGSVGASSEFPDGNFPARLAVDGDVTTSWFSAGPGADGTTVFEWGTADGNPVLVSSVTIISNRAHPEFPTGFGFGEVIVRVVGADGVMVYESAPQPLPGTPDPDVTVTPNATGVYVQLIFTGHEALDCGGIAELQVIGSR